MIDKEDLLNEMYRLKRYKEQPTLSIMPEFDTVSLGAVINKIRELSFEEEEEVEFEEVIYNVIHKIAGAKRGMDRALEELTNDEKSFVMQMLKSTSEDE